MERISALIEKLRGQFAAGADIEQLLLTTQLLEGELRYHRQKGTVPASPLVAVLMPNNGNRPVQRQEPVRTVDPNPVHERYQPQAKEAPQEAREIPPEAREAPQVSEPPAQDAAGVPSPAGEQAPKEKAAERAREHEPIAFNPIKDVPTLTHQIPQEARGKEVGKELNEAIARENGLSLNDALKGQQRELSAVLTEAPIRDLRKAIGINDRYVFISELFRGDEIMYERSVKTINNFSILQEAYYWMERELKLKLAWDEDRKSTQLFYQLVRRRFS